MKLRRPAALQKPGCRMLKEAGSCAGPLLHTIFQSQHQRTGAFLPRPFPRAQRPDARACSMRTAGKVQPLLNQRILQINTEVLYSLDDLVAPHHTRKLNNQTLNIWPGRGLEASILQEQRTPLRLTWWLHGEKSCSRSPVSTLEVLTGQGCRFSPRSLPSPAACLCRQSCALGGSRHLSLPLCKFPFVLLPKVGGQCNSLILDVDALVAASPSFKGHAESVLGKPGVSPGEEAQGPLGLRGENASA